ncbi:hypothetical protein CHS0354_002049 [Potamilus streckersoni]|uniref:Solute-binding protein family 3/N-terminal domain-containing protein n=1 Tax=Potamilus streckersoni TaxID=2493646 RepID=A0AAE0T600_9BIVA|nr:hypothetical protein CHS0354_002049 [Potamilus streckersoni]
MRYVRNKIVPVGNTGRIVCTAKAFIMLTVTIWTGCLFIVLPLLAQQKTDGTTDILKSEVLERIIKKQKITVGVSADYRPFTYVDFNGQTIGFEIDLIADVAQQLGVGYETVPVPITNRVNMLLQNEAGLADWAVCAGILDRRVCAVKEAFINLDIQQKYLLNLNTYDSIDEVMVKLKNNECVLWIFDEAYLAPLMYKKGWEDFRIVLIGETPLTWHIAVKPGEENSPLGLILSEVVKNWHRQGIIPRLEWKWRLPYSAFAAMKSHNRQRKNTAPFAKIERMLCIIKRTAYEYYTQNPELKDKYPALQKNTRDRLEQNNLNHHRLLRNLYDLNETLGLGIQFFEEHEIAKCRPQQNDLIISFGGDGTFLSCARSFPDTLLLGINSDFRRFDSGKGSYGALTALNFMNLSKGLKLIQAGKYCLRQWKRLEADLNGTLIERSAVNDIYIGNGVSYATSDLSLRYEGREEDFQCSGLVVCTGMGSHAWYRTGGGTPFHNSLDIFGFAVLMPGTKKRYHYTSGILPHGDELEVYPNREGYIISFDSKPDIITTGIGDVICIRLSDRNPVNVISFS